MSATNVENEHAAATVLAGTQEGEGLQGMADSITSQEDRSDDLGSMSPLIVATIIGLLASIPLGWLLSHAAQLPFYLGLFFFPLFGLMIGAVVYRVAHRSRPYAMVPLLVCTSLVVICCWMFSMWVEAQGMPTWVAAHASRNPRLKLHDQSIGEYRLAVADQARLFLQTSYPPGGTLGYVRWAYSSGEITKEIVPGLLRPIHATQTGMWWLMRVGLSVGLLAFGIGSQTLVLRLKS